MTNKLTIRQAFIAGFFTAGAATLINSIIYLIAHASGIIRDDIFVKPDTPLTIVPVIISSIIPSIIGGLIFFLFNKYSQKGFRNFAIFGTIAFILMLIPPFKIKDVSFSYALTLELMHLTVFCILLYIISRKKSMLNN